jgi:hypothetical protein
VRNRLVLVPDETWQCAEEVAIVDYDLVRLCPYRSRHLPRVSELAECPRLECDRERLERPPEHRRHERRNRAAVDPSRQEHAERNIAHQPELDGLLEQLPKTAHVVGQARGAGRGVALAGGHIPIAPAGDLAALEREDVSGQKLVDPLEERLLIGNRARRQQFRNRGLVGAGRNPAACENALDL